MKIKLAMDGDIWLEKEYSQVENLYNRCIDELINISYTIMDNSRKVVRNCFANSK
jgi:hypothetical protein